MKFSFWYRYLILSVKRTLKKPFSILLLCLFPLITFLFLNFGSQETGLYVAVHADAGDGFSQKLVSKLADRNGIYHFYQVDSKELLYQDVASGYAECGYVFPDELLDNLDAGRKKNLVDVVVSTSTTMSKITNEIVYSELFEEYSLCILEDYLTESGTLEGITDSEIESLYRKYLSNGSTFAFDFTGAYQDYHAIRNGMTEHTVTGMIGILILLGGFSGLFQYADDNKQKIYASIPASSKRLLALTQIACPLLLFLLAGGLCLVQIGSFTDTGSILRYLCYGLLVLLVCILLYPFLRFRMILLVILPLYLIGCMIFTPMFIDITLYLPKLAWISRLFITYYLL